MSITVTPEQMEKRISRHKDLRPQPGIFLDFALPECEREIFRIWGHGVKDRRELAIPPAIEDPQDFHLGMARCKPGHGAALHAHVTDEVFVAIEGRWEIMWGDEGEHSTILEKFDVIAVPPGIMRGFRNISDETACLFTVMGGADAGPLTWAPQVLRRAKERGLELDENGHVRKVAAQA